MGKYVCPYCGEQERFVYDEAPSLGTHISRDRCGTCLKILNYNLLRDFPEENLKILTTTNLSTRNKLRIDGKYILSSKHYIATSRRVHCLSDDNEIAQLYHQVFLEFPNHWEAIFFNSLYTLKTNEPIVNMTYYKIFANKVIESIKAAERDFSGEELNIIIGEIVEETILVFNLLIDQWEKISLSYMTGDYEKAGRILISMDIALIYDLMVEYLFDKREIYDESWILLTQHGGFFVELFGLSKKQFIGPILEQGTELLNQYPIHYTAKNIYMDCLKIERQEKSLNDWFNL